MTLTLSQAAALAGISQRRMRELCEQGRVKGASRHGRPWAIETTGKLEFIDYPKRPGRPRKTAVRED